MGADFDFERPRDCTHNPQKCPSGAAVGNSADIAYTLGRVEMLLAELQSAGVVLSIVDEGLAFDAPAGVMTDDLLARLRADREGLRAALAGPSVGRVVHCKREPFDVRIDRKSKWGNPFVIGPDGDRAEVIAKYRRWIVGRPELMAALPELRGKVLGCWCAPLACHGDVLIELLAEPKVKATSIVCPWCRSDRLADVPEGVRCERCERMAWIVAGASWVRADAIGDDVEWLRPDEIDACPRCRDLRDTMTALGGWACSRCDPQRAKATARVIGIRERILRRG